MDLREFFNSLFNQYTPNRAGWRSEELHGSASGSRPPRNRRFQNYPVVDRSACMHYILRGWMLLYKEIT